MPLSERSTDDLYRELAKAEAAIDAAYWAFTRQARAKPPSTVCPEAYAARTQIRAELKRRAMATAPASV